MTRDKFRITRALLAFVVLGAVASAGEAADAGAPDETASGARAVLWERIFTYAEALPDALGRPGGLETSGELLGEECETLLPERYAEAALRADAADLDNDLGLEVRGGYTYREGGGSGSDFDQGFDDSLDGDLGRGGGSGDDRHDAYVELSYDVLSSGYRRRRERAEILRGRAELAAIEAATVSRERRQLCRRDHLAESFVAPRARLLELKRALLEDLLPLARRNYLEGLQFADVYWDVEAELGLAQAELDQLRLLFNLDAVGPLADRYPPLLDVNFNLLLAEMRGSSDLVRRAAVSKQVLRREHRTRSEDRLRLFVRSEQDVADGFDPTLVAGLRFSMPLDRVEDVSLGQRLEAADQDAELAAWRRQNETRLAYQEFREQFQRASRQQHRYRLARERLRRALVAQQLDELDADTAAAILALRNTIEATLELTASLEELYQRVNEILRRARLDYRDDFVRVVAPHTGGDRARTGRRAVYLWSDTLNRQPLNVLVEFMVAKSVDEALVSFGRRTDRDKLAAFVDAAAGRGIETTLVLGGADWALPASRARTLARLEEACAVLPRLHLDIEPHTLADFEAQESTYLRQFEDLVAEARTTLDDNCGLSLAVPTHWPETVYASVLPHVDRLHVMAYETDDPARIIDRLEQVTGRTGAENVSLALRVRDFADEWALEQAIDVVAGKLGIGAFTLHDAEEYIISTGSML